MFARKQSHNTTANQFDHNFLIDGKQIDQSTADIGTTPYPSTLSVAFTIWTEGGFLFMARVGTTAPVNHVLPLAADYAYAESTDQVLITPVIPIANATRMYKLYVNALSVVGSDNLGVSPEGYKCYYRTSGISDNTGSWTLINKDGDLSSLGAISQIQFRFLFRTIGMTCVPARLINLALIYEDDATDSHYTPSVDFSNSTTRRFAWRQSVAWGSNIPDLRINVTNVGTLTNVINDTVVSSAQGVWEYSDDDGASWNAWSVSADAIGNYIRYTANSLPASITVRAILTQA